MLGRVDGTPQWKMQVGRSKVQPVERGQREEGGEGEEREGRQKAKERLGDDRCRP